MPLTYPAINLTIAGNSTSAGAGYALISSGTLTLAGGDNITLSQNGNVITISGGAGGGGAFSAGASNLGNTSGVTGTVGSQLVLAGGNYITLSQSINGASATLTISGPTVATLTVYEPYPMHNTGTGTISLNSNTSGAMSLYRFNVTAPCFAEVMQMVVSMNMTTGGTSSFRQSGTLEWGIYSNPSGANSTHLSLMGSSSLSYAVTYNNSSMTINQVTTTHAGGVYSTGATNSAGLNISSQYTGLKLLMLGLNSTLTMGDYWVGIHHRNSTSSFNSGIRMSLYGNTHTLTGLAPFGSLSSAFTTGTGVPSGLGGNWLYCHGSYTLAGLTGLTNEITMSQITANVGLMPYMKFISRI